MNYLIFLYCFALWSDIDECAEGVEADPSKPPCDDQSALCVNGVGSFQCHCYPGYEHVEEDTKQLNRQCLGKTQPLVDDIC